MDPKLKAQLESGNIAQRRNAVTAMGKSMNPDYVPMLINAYKNDTDVLVPSMAINSLSMIGSPEAKEFLQASELNQQRIIERQFKYKTPTAEALECWEHVKEMTRKAEEGKTDDAFLRDIVSEIARAIHKAEAPFPDAYAALAWYLFDLKDEKRAIRYFTIALQQDPNNFRAQLVKIFVDSKSVGQVSLKPGSFFDFSGGSIESMAFGSVFKTITTAILTGHAAISQSNFFYSMNKLATIFQTHCDLGIDIDEYIFMANNLIQFGDYICDAPAIASKPNLYDAVAKTEVKLNTPDPKNEVLAIKEKAEGRSILYNSGL